MKAISLQMEHQRNMCVALTLKYFFLSNAKAAIIFLRIYVVVVVISFRFHAFTFFLYQSHRLFVCGGEYLLACPQQK